MRLGVHCQRRVHPAALAGDKPRWMPQQSCASRAIAAAASWVVSGPSFWQLVAFATSITEKLAHPDAAHTHQMKHQHVVTAKNPMQACQKGTIWRNSTRQLSAFHYAALQRPCTLFFFPVTILSTSPYRHPAGMPEASYTNHETGAIPDSRTLRARVAALVKYRPPRTRWMNGW